MTTKTLLILAAGMGSRYGGNKQIEHLTKGRAMMMDFAIYDAIKAGFNKIVFIIRKDFSDTFKQATQQRWAEKIDLFYVYQDTQTMLPLTHIYHNTTELETLQHSIEKHTLQNHNVKEIPFFSETDFLDASLLKLRKKPWGTSHAILCAQACLNEPFALINADDFYGQQAYEVAAQALENIRTDQDAAAILYPIAHTLSENGHVNRGLCIVQNGYLSSVREAFALHRSSNNHTIIDKEGEKVADNQLVAMNFWALPPRITEHLKTDFLLFLQQLCTLSKNSPDPEKTMNSQEFLLPSCLNDYIQKKYLRIRSLSTHSKWLGITYKEDLPQVRTQITDLIQQGHYPLSL